MPTPNEAPLWIRAFVDELTECVKPHAFIGTLGYRYMSPDDPNNVSNAWQVLVYPSPNELRGSALHDGALFVPGFTLNVSKILQYLPRYEEITWNAPVKSSGFLDGHEISIRCWYGDKALLLRVFARPPVDEPPAYAVNPQTGSIVELQK